MIKKIQKEYLENEYAVCIIKLIIFGITVYVNKTYTTNKNIKLRIIFICFSPFP